MKYAVAGRIYSDFSAARDYANLLHKIANLIVAVEAVPDDFLSSVAGSGHDDTHPPASPK